MSFLDSVANALAKRGLDAVWPQGQDGPRTAYPLTYDHPPNTRASIAVPDWRLAKLGLPTRREANIAHASAVESYNESRVLAEIYGLGLGTAAWIGTRIAFRV